MLGEELGEEGHRLSAAADMLEPGIDIHWLGKHPKSSQSAQGAAPPRGRDRNPNHDTANRRRTGSFG